MKKINLNFATNESAQGAFNTLSLLFKTNLNKKSIVTLKRKLAILFGTNPKNVYTFLSARSALKIFLQSLNFPKESEIIVLGFTCEAVVLPILSCGLKPIYVDMEIDTYSISYNELITKITKKTKLIILQHTFSMTPKYRKKIIKLAKEKNILVIEDLAHGFHTNISNNNSNDIKTIKLLSFGRSKLLSTVHGGAIIIPKTIDRKSFEITYDELDYPSKWLVIQSLLYKVISPVIAFSSDLLIKLLSV